MRTQFRPFPLISLLVVAALVSPAVPARATSDAVINVNTLADELNTDGDCSLREAIQAANTNSAVDACPAGAGDDKINLPDGMITLSRAGADEDNNVTGDLDIRGNLVIQGAGRDSTIIDGGYKNPSTYIDRVFHITGPYTVVISRLTIQHGFASTGLLGGGGILNQGTLTLQDVSMQDNRAVNVGGAIDNYLGTATLYNTFVNNNYSTKDGGGIFNNGQLLLNTSTISGNVAVNGGGGLDNRGGATIQNVTISGNSASAGGGLFNDGEGLFVLYSSLVANTATALPGNKGGNIEIAESIRMKTTIVANSLSGPNCAGSNTIVSEGFNLENTDTCNFIDATDVINVDPMIDPLADNGGPTLTHALLLGSPAIDVADDIDCPEKDQRGAFRPADGDGDEVAICDIGAFEYEGVFPKFIFIPRATR